MTVRLWESEKPQKLHSAIKPRMRKRQVARDRKVTELLNAGLGSARVAVDKGYWDHFGGIGALAFGLDKRPTTLRMWL